MSAETASAADLSAGCGSAAPESLRQTFYPGRGDAFSFLFITKPEWRRQSTAEITVMNRVRMKETSSVPGIQYRPRVSVSCPEERQRLSLYFMTPFLYRTLGTGMREDRIISRGINEVLKRLNGSFAKEETGARNAYSVR